LQIPAKERTETLGIITKVIRADKSRRSRLHDEKGNFIGWKRALLHAPPAILTGILRITIDYRPELPWISYAAIKLLKGFLSKESRILEFGSGMSTIWYATHAKEVCSIENNEYWFEQVNAILRKRQLNNVVYEFTTDEQEYCSFQSDTAIGFDLIIIDGCYRSRCVVNAVKLLRPGGILYLDNSDRDSIEGGGDMRYAEQYALHFAREKNGSVSYFVDFAPTQFFVQQGMMVKLPKP